MKKMIFAASIAAFAMISCSNENPTTNQSQEMVPMQFASKVLDVETRAVVNEGSTFSPSVWAYHGSENIYIPSITFENASSVVQAPNAFYPVGEETEVSFVGFHPSVADSPLATKKVTYNITGAEDVMYAKKVTNTKSKAKINTHPLLSFEHLLTQLQFKVVAESAEAATAWGNVTSIVITEQNKKFELDITSGILTAKDSPAKQGTITVSSSAITLGTAPVAGGTVMVQSKLGTSETKIEIKTVNHPDPVIVSLTGKAFEISKANEITLTFKATAISLKASVAQWTTGANENANIQ